MCTKHKTQTREIGKHDCRIGSFCKSLKDGRLNYMRLGCKRWSCKRCRPKLIRRWVDHLLKKTDCFPALYRTVVPANQWESFRARLRRAESRYFSVRLPGGRAVYYETGLGTADEDRLDIESAQQRFRREVKDNACDLGHPVSTCREWKLEEHESRYELIAFSKTKTVSDVLAAAKSVEERGHQLKLKAWDSDLASGVSIDGGFEAQLALLRELREHKCCSVLNACPQVSTKREKGGITVRETGRASFVTGPQYHQTE